MSTSILTGLGFGLFGYLSGSLTFSIWITRLFKGVDVRDSGSGHATTTNTIRQAGFGPGLLVLMLDLSKGLIPTLLALRYTTEAWIPPLTAALVVIGHCWPVLAGFRGGMGNASAAGCLLAATPLGFLIAVATLILLVLLIRHSARASLVTGLIMAPILWLIHQPLSAVWIAAAAGLVLAYRFLIDWNRHYRELWLDRENPHK